jgi:hypothetical protein
MSETLEDALDKAAMAILEAATGTAIVGEGETAIPVSLEAKIKAFSAVAEYAEKRAKTRPPPKQESKFDAVKSTFRGDTTKGRRSGKAASDSGPGGDGSDA